jgi:hypothetical protein
MLVLKTIDHIQYLINCKVHWKEFASFYIFLEWPAQVGISCSGVYGNGVGPLSFEFMGHGSCGLIEGGLGHAITVPASQFIVANASHTCTEVDNDRFRFFFSVGFQLPLESLDEHDVSNHIHSHGVFQPLSFYACQGSLGTRRGGSISQDSGDIKESMHTFGVMGFNCSQEADALWKEKLQPTPGIVEFSSWGRCIDRVGILGAQAPYLLWLRFHDQMMPTFAVGDRS